MFAEIMVVRVGESGGMPPGLSEIISKLLICNVQCIKSGAHNDVDQKA